jgi:hypothetical protein
MDNLIIKTGIIILAIIAILYVTSLGIFITDYTKCVFFNNESVCKSLEVKATLY